MLYVIRDWLPFALVLIAYDLSRGAADPDRAPDAVALAGRRGSLDVLRDDADGVAAGAAEAARSRRGGRWSSAASTCRSSSCRTWWPGRCGCATARNGRRSSGCSSGLSFAGLVIYALLPAAPLGRRPLHAGRCRRRPRPDPRCMFRPARGVPDGGLLGAMQSTQDGANDWIERIVGRGWGKLNLHSATALLDQGQASVNLVAAIPSLHAGMTAARGGVSVEPGAPRLAAAAGGLSADHGVHAGVHRRALRRRHPVGLGARGRGDPSAQPPSVETTASRGGSDQCRARHVI